MKEASPPPPFSCSHCGEVSDTFSNVCPACGRPYFRDYIDVRKHPRDPNLTGTFAYQRFWARVFLALIVLAAILTILMILLF